ncbi:hypothetical protein VB002_15225 [Campylobacter concisus]
MFKSNLQANSLIGLENGKSITTKEIYNITYLENDLKFKELSSKDRLYKR